MSSEPQQLEAGIAALAAQRSVPCDAVVDATLRQSFLKNIAEHRDIVLRLRSRRSADAVAA